MNEKMIKLINRGYKRGELMVMDDLSIDLLHEAPRTEGVWNGRGKNGHGQIAPLPVDKP